MRARVGEVADWGLAAEAEEGDFAVGAGDLRPRVRGAGAEVTRRSRMRLMLRPVLAETAMISSGEQPSRLMSWDLTRPTSAAGRSILLMTGMI